MVRQAVGSHLAWPRDMVIFPTVIKKKKVKEIPLSKAKSELLCLQEEFDSAKTHKNVPSCFSLLYKHAKTFMKATRASLPISCNTEVFGVEKIIFILHKNIIALLEYDMIGQSTIATYMAYLHTVVTENDDLDLFAFCDPGVTFSLNKGFESYIVNWLKEGNVDRVFFLPHNENQHWILVIIWEGDIYIYNPLSHPHHFPKLEKALSSAIKTFNAETGRGNKPAKTKNLIGSPKQPGGHECGYVVLCYMKKIISDREMTFRTKLEYGDEYGWVDWFLVVDMDVGCLLDVGMVKCWLSENAVGFWL
ncbi:uncharacterized protein LOC141665654 [Apium graveolens]|uniref:uncharacterized protein LOC141665654 n=1 Tax=Apium graveolens TaxID=4045 RepID=UPI003D7B1185